MKLRLVATSATLLLLFTACGPTEGETQKDAAPSAGCAFGEFDCGDGHQCVDSDDVCDGTTNCNNGADEADCGCGAGMWTCTDGNCIHAAFVCDHVMNCPDGSDEEDCPGP